MLYVVVCKRQPVLKLPAIFSDYKYVKVFIPREENKNEEGTLPFQFEYDIVDNVGISREDFNEDFFTLIGDILVDIIDEQIKEDNFEYTSND